MTIPCIDFGIVNYNGGPFLKRCVESILSIENIAVNIFIYDNQSDDNSLKLLSPLNAHLTIIKSDKNSGYAHACNELLQIMTSDIIVLCNMDLTFDTKWGEEILKVFEKTPHQKSVASMVFRSTDEGEINSSGIGFYKDLYAQNIDTPLISKARYPEVFGCYGAVMCLKKEVINQIGYFDADYFLFYEETDFYWRMNLHGFNTVMCPKAKVYHYHSLSTVRYSPLKLFYAERNRIWTCFKILPLWYLLLIYPLSVYRFYKMAKNGVPEFSGDGTKISKKTILRTIIKAWLQAPLKFLREMRKRKTIWDGLSISPGHTLKILKKYQFSAGSIVKK